MIVPGLSLSYYVRQIQETGAGYVMFGKGTGRESDSVVDEERDWNVRR